jgi:elongation factor P
MIDVNALRKGVTYTLDGELYRVVDYHHHKPGRGKATIRVKVRNLRTGTLTEQTFTSGDRVQDIRLETRVVQYLYGDGEFLHFMDIDNYEQPQMRADIFGDDLLYMTENLELKLMSYEGEIIDYELPVTVEQEVAEAEMAVAGDTATGATKQVVTSTGLKVSVPLFVEVGDTIRIDTRSGGYLTRV